MIDLETRASFFARALCVADFQFVSTGIEILTFNLIRNSIDAPQ
jgi:hypothetical protein